MHEPSLPGPAGNSPDATAAAGSRDDDRHQRLLRVLAGDLPCVRCRYSLRGLSIVGVCPECGTPVRATVLAAVDPLSPALTPIRWRGAVAAGVVAWATGALFAALMLWTLHAIRLGVRPLLAHHGMLSDMEEWLNVAAAAAAGVSALGAATLIRPHARLRWWRVLAATAGTLSQAGLVCVLHAFVQAESRGWGMPPAGLAHLFWTDLPGADRTALRLVLGALMGLAVAGLWPNFRLLAFRSLVMRLGHVDRQPMAAMLAALAVAAAGDVVHVMSGQVWGLRPPLPAVVAAGTFLIVLGSVLLTFGLWQLTVDAWRIARVVLSPPLALSQVLDRRSRVSGPVPVVERRGPPPGLESERET